MRKKPEKVSSRGYQRFLTASSGASLDLVSSIERYFETSLKFWFVTVQALFVILLKCDCLKFSHTPGSS